MTSRTLKWLAAGAALFGGLLAGSTAVRTVTQVPAWAALGALPWATYSRAENSALGSVWYPATGLAALLLTVGTAIAFRFSRHGRASAFPVYFAVVPTVLSALITLVAVVPIMSGLNAAATNGPALELLFLRVASWWRVNDLLHVLAFMGNLWALSTIASRAS